MCWCVCRFVAGSGNDNSAERNKQRLQEPCVCVTTFNMVAHKGKRSAYGEEVRLRRSYVLPVGTLRRLCFQCSRGQLVGTAWPGVLAAAGRRYDSEQELRPGLRGWSLLLLHVILLEAASLQSASTTGCSWDNPGYDVRRLAAWCCR